MICRLNICLSRWSKFFSISFLFSVLKIAESWYWLHKKSVMYQSWTNLPRHSYLTVWACHWSQSLPVKDNKLKYIWTHLLSSRRREENMCVRWNLTHSPGGSIVCSSLFQGPIKWNHTCGTQLMDIPGGRCILCCVACVLCYGVCTWWVGGPELVA